ncbi:MAG: anaerobic ribonucleoside-triphosphate reductase activating protein [Candidatus Micrarchaeota archaeon]
MLEIKGLQKTSLVDYPSNICSTIFLGGCNFRCPFCHNRELVLTPEKLPSISEEEILSFLEKRKGYIDGVTISGGEPTIHAGLPEFVRKIKQIPLLVKLDTNGSNPAMLEKLLRAKLVDYVALDIKSSREKYAQAAGAVVDLPALEKSISLIRELAPAYEFRTTAVPTLVEREDVEAIGKWLKGAERYALQQFRPQNTLDARFSKISPHSKETLEEFARIARAYFKNVEIRNV